jgi:hypothetical protein
MERTSIITSLYLALSKDFPSLTLTTHGFPNSDSLLQYFKKVPHILEKADLKETVRITDHGDILDISIRANIHRDSDYYQDFAGQYVLAYITTSNGEQHFFGSNSNPLSFQYTRDTGAANADSRDTTLILGQVIPL